MATALLKTPSLPPTAVLWLAAASLLAVLPHAPRQPLWVSICFVALMAWWVLGALRYWTLPDPHHRPLFFLKQVLALASCAGVYLTYGVSFGRNAGVSLLILLLALKVLEMRRRREYFLVVFLGYFLILTHFFYSQSVGAGFYMLLVVTALTACLIAINDHRGGMAAADKAILAGRLVVQAVPLTLLMFVLFPRVPGPLWGLPKDAYAGVSGLSEQMSPGNLTQLGLSDAPAFRVEFKGRPPHTRTLYWRGPVLTQTDGRTWTKGVTGDLPAPEIVPRGDHYEYTVTLEPTNQRWLFLMETPSYLPADTRLSRDLRVLMPRPVTQRLRYSAQSYTRSQNTDFDLREIYEALALPSGFHPRALALGREWREKSHNAKEVIQQALNFFRQEDFYYTLTPPPLTGDAVDEFLFSSRRGFCEHYAAAFTILMRAAGIPTRVVTGYQGGEYNSIGGYLLVRQRDAHAWTEVWLGASGWVRIDPTGAVAPNRVEQGIDQVIPPQLVGMTLDLEPGSKVLQVWKRLRNTWDAVNNRWNQWVLGYNNHRQQELLTRLGLQTDMGTLILWFTVLSTATLAVMAVLLLTAARPFRDPLRLAYDRFCAKLARRGLARATHEGPMDFARRIAALRPQLADSVSHITGLYIRARYGGHPEDAGLLTTAVRQFRVAKT